MIFFSFYEIASKTLHPPTAAPAPSAALQKPLWPPTKEQHDDSEGHVLAPPSCSVSK